MASDTLTLSANSSRYYAALEKLKAAGGADRVRDDETKLRLYGLFKVATAPSAEVPAPRGPVLSLLDPRRSAMNEAWRRASRETGGSADRAMGLYADTVDALLR